MKDYKIIYRYGEYKSCEGQFKHPYFDFIVQGTGEYAFHYSLFTLEFQINALEEKSIYRAYAPSVQSLDLDSYYIEETLRILKRLSAIRTIRQVVNVLQQLKIKRSIYDSPTYSYIPYRFRKVRDLYIEAQKKGLKLSA